MIRRESTTRRRRGQAAVETMLLTFTVMLVLLGLVHLFSVTWASQNAHIRAREAVFHGDAYLDVSNGYTEPSTAPFSASLPGPGGNYTVASGYEVDFAFTASANDESRDDYFEAQSIEVDAKIVRTMPTQ